MPPNHEVMLPGAYQEVMELYKTHSNMDETGC
jgi:hypothetical protein